MTPCEGVPFAQVTGAPGLPGLGHQSRLFGEAVWRRSTSAPEVRPVLRVGTHPTVLLSLLVHRQVSHASSRTHFGLRTRPPRVHTASLQMRPQPLGTLIQLTITHEGDIPRGRVRVLPGGGIRRRRGQQSRPPTRRMPPAMRKCPRTRRTSPATAPECGVLMPRPRTPVRRAGFDCRYSPPRQGVTRLLAVTRMAPVIYCTRVGCHWRRVGCTPGRWGLRAVRTTPGQ